MMRILPLCSLEQYYMTKNRLFMLAEAAVNVFEYNNIYILAILCMICTIQTLLLRCTVSFSMDVHTLHILICKW